MSVHRDPADAVEAAQQEDNGGGAAGEQADQPVTDDGDPESAPDHSEFAADADGRGVRQTVGDLGDCAVEPASAGRAPVCTRPGEMEY